jgi:hypothetical protein
MSHREPEDIQTKSLDAQQTVAASLRPLEAVRAPESLRRSIEQMTDEAASRRAPRILLPRLRLAGVGALAAAAAVTIAVLLSPGGPPTPTVLEASRLALGAATLPSPPENPHNRGQLTRSVGGVPYPYWGGRGGWRTAGARVDKLSGHTITTVFYATRSGSRIGYAIVAGQPLPVPSGGTAIVRDGVRFAVLDSAGGTVLTWREAGHTCILVGHDVPARTLLGLVS